MYYNKPKVYKNQATVDIVNAGIPYYVGNPDYGFEGVHVPIAGTVSELTRINEKTGELLINLPDANTSTWVTCVINNPESDKIYRRCSLKDVGVIHQTYNSRMAFLDPFSAKYYAETGKLA